MITTYSAFYEKAKENEKREALKFFKEHGDWSFSFRDRRISIECATESRIVTVTAISCDGSTLYVQYDQRDGPHGSCTSEALLPGELDRLTTCAALLSGVRTEEQQVTNGKQQENGE